MKKNKKKIIAIITIIVIIIYRRKREISTCEENESSIDMEAETILVNTKEATISLFTTVNEESDPFSQDFEENAFF